VTKRTVRRWEREPSFASHVNLATAAYLVEKVDPALATEMRSAAHGLIVALGAPPGATIKAEPPVPSPELQAIDALAIAAARALGVTRRRSRWC
jgi:hypothetical protein